MKAVVDTNVLIRALIKPQGTVGPIISRLRNGDYTLVYSLPILDELIEKLALPRIRRKYHVRNEEVEALVALMALRGVLVRPEQRIKVCRDPDDDMFIEAAIAGGVTYLVTGDKDLLTLKVFETVNIVTPRTFLAAF
jgi:uncharacterized protein